MNRDSEYKSYVFEGENFPPIGKKLSTETGELVDKTEQEKLDSEEILLSDVKAKLYEQTNQIRDEILKAGKTDFIPVNGLLYDADIQAVANIQEVLLFLGNGGQLPEGFVWRTANNSNVPMTTESFKTFAQEFTAQYFVWKNLVYVKSWETKEQIKNLKKSNVLSYNPREAMNHV
jgi:hypothetical protein